jgi:selenocysteine lyase/cysteine desulfurase
MSPARFRALFPALRSTVWLDTPAAPLGWCEVRATALGDRVRFGFHYFNDDNDVRATLRVLDHDHRGPA